MFMKHDWSRFLSIKIDPSNIPVTLNFIEKIWKSYEPNRPIDYFFLDDTFNTMYRVESRLGKTFGIFTFIAISIACLGLFSLSAFTIERRTKEMGIRKVLGASSSSIFITVSKEFLILVLLSNLLAWPLAYYVSHSWLQRFAYRIGLSFAPFLFSGMLAMIIAFITVSFLSIKAAKANPVDSLRYE